MAINFPNSPIAGEYFVTGGLTYQYTGTVWVSINTKTNNAYNQANTATIIASDAFTQANSSFIHANAAFLAANAAATSANLTIAWNQANSAYVHANSGFNQANNANIYAFGAHQTANSAQIHANAAFLQANSANIYAFGAHRTANSAQVHANAAFLQANQVGGAVSTANGALAAANTNMVFKTGNTMTGNLVMSSANIAFTTISNSGIYWSGTSFIRLSVANTLVFGTSSSEDLRIDASGNVGIGTVSPVATLDVSGSFSVAKANALNQTLTDGATINWDTSLGQVATVTLAGNRTLNNATNLRVGTYILHVIQDGVGGRTLSFQRGYKFTGNVIPTLTSAAGSRDMFSFVSDGTNLYGAFIPDVRS